MKKLLASVAVVAITATPLALAAPAEADPTYTVTGGQVVTYDPDARRGTTDIQVACVADVSTTAAVTVEVDQADAGGPGERAWSFLVLGDIRCDPTPVVQSVSLIIEPDPSSPGFVEGVADLGVSFTPAGAESPETVHVSTQISVPPTS